MNLCLVRKAKPTNPEADLRPSLRDLVLLCRLTQHARTAKTARSGRTGLLSCPPSGRRRARSHILKRPFRCAWNVETARTAPAGGRTFSTGLQSRPAQRTGHPRILGLESLFQRWLWICVPDADYKTRWVVYCRPMHFRTYSLIHNHSNAHRMVCSVILGLT
jgi:hypothetical protein